MGNFDQDNKLWGLLGFFVPPVGLILFLVWRLERPKDGHHALVGAIIGFVFYLMIRLVFGFLWFIYFSPFFEDFFPMMH